MFTDDDRRRLYDALEHSLGHDPASILMAHLPPVGWADLATKGDVAELKGDIGELRGDMAGLRGEMAELRGEFRALPAKMIVANLATSFAFGGLVLAAVALT